MDKIFSELGVLKAEITDIVKKPELHMATSDEHVNTDEPHLLRNQAAYVPHLFRTHVALASHRCQTCDACAYNIRFELLRTTSLEET